MSKTYATITAADIEYAVGTNFAVTTTDRGWIEIRLDPAHALRPAEVAGYDFLRIVQDDECHYRLIHLKHNEVLCGEASFSNSMVSYLPNAVAEFCETTY